MYVVLSLKHRQSKQVGKNPDMSKYYVTPFSCRLNWDLLSEIFPCRVQSLSPGLNCLKKMSGPFALLHNHTDNYIANQCMVSFIKRFEMSKRS